MSVETITNSEEFKKAICNPPLSVIHFAAEWAAQCAQVTDIMKELARQPGLEANHYYILEAENFPEISSQHEVRAVPTVLLFKDSNVVERIDGINIPDLTNKVRIHSRVPNINALTLEDRLRELTHKSKVMVFIKGDRHQPRCGFTRSLIEILNETGVEYETFDILSDEEVRQGLKKYSDWPTYPQLYVKGDLIGGLDIVKELKAGGELQSTLNA